METNAILALCAFLALMSVSFAQVADYSYWKVVSWTTWRYFGPADYGFETSGFSSRVPIGTMADYEYLDMYSPATLVPQGPKDCPRVNGVPTNC